MSAAAITVTNWTPRTAGALLGFCDAEMPSGLILHEVAIMRGKDGGFWATPPSKAMLDRDGRVMTDANGRRRYVPTVSFATKAARARFSAVVIEALRQSHPEITP